MFSSSLSKIKGTIFYRGGIAALDQGMLSMINLGVQILLIKTVIKSEYGYYSIALSVIMYLMSFQNSVVNTPITVSIAGKTKEAKDKYISAIFSGQIIALIVVGLAGLLIVFILFNIGMSIEKSLIASSLCIGSFGILNREFLRSYFFAEEEPIKVLKLDFYYGVIYAGLILITYLLIGINVPLIIFFMGLASGFDSLIINKRLKFNFNLQNIKESYLENWQISKWSLIGITVTQLQGYSYLYVIGGLLGSNAVADVSASRLLLLPVGLITNGWGNVIRPYGAKLREQNQLKRFFKNLIFAGISFPILILIVSIVLYFSSGILLKMVFTKDYQTVFDYLFYWAVLSSVGFLRANASYGLQVVKKFKSLALFNGVTMIITITLAFILTNQFQIKGALIASLCGEVLFATILWCNLYKAIYNTKQVIND